MSPVRFVNQLALVLQSPNLGRKFPELKAMQLSWTAVLWGAAAEAAGDVAN